MALSVEAIKQQIAQPSKDGAIAKARHQQARLRFHCEAWMSSQQNQPALADFLAFVKNLLPADKFEMFKTMLRYPIATNEVTGIVFDKLSRIFDGRNAAFNYSFKKNELAQDWEYYRQEVLREPEVWHDEAWAKFRTEINSFVVVDMPSEQDGERPSPYFYWVGLERVISYELDAKGNVLWIIFRQDDEHVVVIDDERYRVFFCKNNQLNETPEIDGGAGHGLGYCPVTFFWNEPLNNESLDVKASPLSRQLERLDWYLFFFISKRHLDTYGAYPIYSGYEQQCDYSNEANGEFCEGGYLKNAKGQYVHDANGITKCPRCGDKRIVGVGSYIEVPVPNEGQPDLRNPVQILSVDTTSLSYNVAECDRLKQEIITSVCGVDAENWSEAVNEKQVNANFESQATILNRVKKGFERVWSFVDATICRLRYGSDFVSCKVNLGTEFYTLTSEELRERYRQAKENGGSEAELEALHNHIVETEFRHDPKQLRRMRILEEIEPYRHLSLTEVVSLHKDGVISEEDMRIKLNFANFVRRFERENINIEEFVAAGDYGKQIEIVNLKFREYAGEN